MARPQAAAETQTEGELAEQTNMRRLGWLYVRRSGFGLVTRHQSLQMLEANLLNLSRDYPGHLCRRDNHISTDGCLRVELLHGISTFWPDETVAEAAFLGRPGMKYVKDAMWDRRLVTRA